MSAFTVYTDDGMLALVVAPDADVARKLAADHVGGLEPEELEDLDVSEIEPIFGDTLEEEPARVIDSDRDFWRYGCREEDQRVCDECGIPHAPVFGVAVCPECGRCVATMTLLGFVECGHKAGCPTPVVAGSDGMSPGME